MSSGVDLEFSAIFQPLSFNQTEIILYYVNMDDLGSDCVRLLSRLLSTADELVMNRLSHAKTRHKFILSRGLLRLFLGHYFQVEPQTIRVAANPWGKLFLPGHRLQFNLSHSGSIWVLALSCSYNVGVDVEHIRPVPCRHRLVQRYATPLEQGYFHTLTMSAQERYFLELWTAKEAYAKALGTGLIGMLRQFRHLDTLNRTRIAPPGCWPAYLQRFDLHNNYIGAVCWGTNPGVNA